MEINLNQKAIDNISIALSKYNYIMDRLNQTNVSLDTAFQKKYNGFYRMRQRPPEYLSFIEAIVIIIIYLNDICTMLAVYS